MKFAIVLLFTLCSASLYADEDYCRDKSDASPDLEPGFNVYFCIGSEELMDRFAEALESADIPYIRYENGYIGYSSEDKQRVKDLGDELVYDYYSNRGSR